MRELPFPHSWSQTREKQVRCTFSSPSCHHPPHTTHVAGWLSSCYSLHGMQTCHSKENPALQDTQDLTPPCVSSGNCPKVWILTSLESRDSWNLSESAEAARWEIQVCGHFRTMSFCCHAAGGECAVRAPQQGGTQETS